MHKYAVVIRLLFSQSKVFKVQCVFWFYSLFILTVNLNILNKYFGMEDGITNCEHTYKVKEAKKREKHERLTDVNKQMKLQSHGLDKTRVPL